MPDIFYLFGRWWKQMLLVIIIAVAIVACYCFYSNLPAIFRWLRLFPASTILTDKARIFNNNIEGLYSSLGNPDDLDKISVPPNWIPFTWLLLMNYNLWDHYKIENKEEQIHISSCMYLKVIVK